MNISIKLLALLSIFVFSFSCAQTTMRNLGEAKKLEVHKKEFIGKPLNYLLSQMKVDIKSIKAWPNKNPAEINRITFRFVSFYEYKKNGSKPMKDRPTQITVVFNQNWEYNGVRCITGNPNCTTWTQEDEKNLGSLIVHDIYVLGKD